MSKKGKKLTPAEKQLIIDCTIRRKITVEFPDDEDFVLFKKGDEEIKKPLDEILKLVRLFD